MTTKITSERITSEYINDLKETVSETVSIWLDDLGNPTKEDIENEIEDIKGTISNECLWALADDIHYENIKEHEEYLQVLEIMLSSFVE